MLHCHGYCYTVKVKNTLSRWFFTMSRLMLRCHGYCFNVKGTVTLSRLLLHCQGYCYNVKVTVTMSRLLLHCQGYCYNVKVIVTMSILLSFRWRQEVHQGRIERQFGDVLSWMKKWQVMVTEDWRIFTLPNRIIKIGRSPKNKKTHLHLYFIARKYLWNNTLVHRVLCGYEVPTNM